jgi:hypothetical protein
MVPLGSLRRSKQSSKRKCRLLITIVKLSTGVSFIVVQRWRRKRSRAEAGFAPHT